MLRSMLDVHVPLMFEQLLAALTPMHELSPRELEVARLLIESDLTQRDVSERLGAGSLNTVRTHVRGVLNKTGKSSNPRAPPGAVNRAG